MIIFVGICIGDNIWLLIKFVIIIICFLIIIFKVNCFFNDCFYCYFLMSCGIIILMNLMMLIYVIFIVVIIEVIYNVIYVINWIFKFSDWFFSFFNCNNFSWLRMINILNSVMINVIVIMDIFEYFVLLKLLNK